jgi:hypothetical protein
MVNLGVIDGRLLVKVSKTELLEKVEVKQSKKRNWKHDRHSQAKHKAEEHQLY